LLALVPALAALISIYGLVANPADIQAQFAALSRAMPAEARTLLEAQMTRIATQQQAAGIAAVISIALALWGGAAGMKTVINALNIIYREAEKRGFVKLTLVALGLTFALVLLGVISIGLIVVVPVVLAYVGLGDAAKLLVSLGRWPLLFAVAMLALALIYHFGPSRERPKWRWVTPGAVIATILWVLASVLFSLYAQHFGSYNKTYGSLGAVVVLMLWLYLSAFALLLGGEINAESEHQTSADTTTGSAEPLGQRGAHMADSTVRRAA
jgi:membrane protein